ncbi:MAG: hypothetical protein ACYC3I_06465 [Gemmataceae bacterium]
MKYELIGLRPASDSEGQAGNYRKVLAILRAANGHRVIAEIGENDCKTWPTLRAAIVQWLTRDGEKRIKEDDLEEPDCLDLPWSAKALADWRDGQKPHTTAGKYYRQARFSNADYLRQLREVNFDNDPAAALARNEEQILLNKARLAALEMQAEKNRSRAIQNIGLELMETIAGTSDAPGSLREHIALMELTPLGKAVLKHRRGA